MNQEREIRDYLIASCHSNKEADAYVQSRLHEKEFISILVFIAVDAADYGGDAPMQAAYYLSLVNSENLKSHENSLLELLTTANGYGGHVALALGRMQSAPALNIIVAELGDGNFPSAWLYKAALNEYQKST